MGQSSDGRQTKPPGFQDLPWSGQTENPDLKPRTSHHRLAGKAAQHASPMGLPQSLAPEGTTVLAVEDTLVNSDVAEKGGSQAVTVLGVTSSTQRGLGSGYGSRPD